MMFTDVTLSDVNFPMSQLKPPTFFLLKKSNVPKNANAWL